MCPRFQTAVDILGRRWTGLVVWALTEGPRRFGELAQKLEVVSERMLSERLKELELEGIVQRQVFAETPVRIEYSLTEKGQALTTVLEAVAQWAEKWVTTTSVEHQPAAEMPRRMRPAKPRATAADEAKKRRRAT
jgi:DNA-binding HxlR family transcriptional regulator